jgi:5-methylthioribose kinase
MAYSTLNLETIIAYVRNHEQSAQYLNPNSDLEVQEIGDGNLNLVWRVFERENRSRSILLKQGLPYLRAAGESWPLSPDRARFEAQALELQHRFASGLIPKPYWFDADMLVNAMEDLTEHQVLRRPMMAGHQFVGLGETIGKFCAKVLFGTSDFAMRPDEKRDLQSQFRNSELCKITEDLIFTEPYMNQAWHGLEIRNRFNPIIEADVTHMQHDSDLKAQVAALKYRFMTHAEALIHGDLHTGSIMARVGTAPDETPDIRVIDPEFAFFGPIGFDLGAFIANLFLSSASHLAHSKTVEARAAYRSYLYDQARACWQAFTTEFMTQFAATNSPSWTSQDFQAMFLRDVLRDLTGFAGAKMIRRIVGFAHVADLEGIANLEHRAHCEAKALELGRKLIMHHSRINQFEDVIDLALEILPVDTQ